MKKIAAIAALVFLQGCVSDQNVHAQPVPKPDSYTASKLDGIFSKTEAERSKGQKIPTAEDISASLMGTPYQSGALIGSSTIPEKLVVDLRHLDCFTFIDNVEALRRSYNYKEYVSQLISVRYAGGKVDFDHRRHFFTDWAQGKDAQAQDITGNLSTSTTSVEKKLNIKADGGFFIPGLPGVSRNVTYIPSQAINDDTLKRLKSGDYIGVYSKLSGLDVSHVGVFINTPQGPVFRNASSRRANMKVVDYPFMEFVVSVPGIVVLRPI